MATKKESTKKSKQIRKSWGDATGDRLAELFERKFPDGTPLVPDSGDASTDIGQLVRGMNKIMYRYYNDGDIAGIGYGKETLDWVFDYMEASAPSHIQSALEEFYEKYSAFDINFEDMDDGELEDYINEQLGTDFSIRYGYEPEEPEKPDEPDRDDYDSDEEYEEALAEYESEMDNYESDMEEYKEEAEKFENFEYYIDNPSAFQLDYGDEYVDSAIRDAESSGYEKDMLALADKIADYVDGKWAEMVYMDEENDRDIDSYTNDSWDYYDASTKKSRNVKIKTTESAKKSIPSIHDMIAQMRQNNNSLVKSRVDLDISKASGYTPSQMLMFADHPGTLRNRYESLYDVEEKVEDTINDMYDALYDGGEVNLADDLSDVKRSYLYQRDYKGVVDIVNGIASESNNPEAQRYADEVARLLQDLI